MASYTVEETAGERIFIDMECPYCGAENEFKYGIPIPAASRRTCSSCDETLKVTPDGTVSEYSKDEVEDKILSFIEGQQYVREFAREHGTSRKEWVYCRKSITIPIVAYLFFAGSFMYGWLQINSFPLFLFMLVMFTGWFIVPVWEKSQEMFFKFDGGGDYDMTLDAVMVHSDIYAENSE